MVPYFIKCFKDVKEDTTNIKTFIKYICIFCVIVNSWLILGSPSLKPIGDWTFSVKKMKISLNDSHSRILPHVSSKETER